MKWSLTGNKGGNNRMTSKDLADECPAVKRPMEYEPTAALVGLKQHSVLFADKLQQSFYFNFLSTVLTTAQQIHVVTDFSNKPQS